MRFRLDELEQKKFLASVAISRYSLKIGEDLHNKINKQILLLKHLEDPSFSKQRWIREAIQDKLKRQEEESSLDGICKERSLNFKLEHFLAKRIDSCINKIKKMRYSFSRKQWFIEAFYEKLDQDEQKAKKLLEKMRELDKLHLS